MSSFYEIIPLDTLFFRGSTPMEAGQYNAVSIFPPPVSVIKGAFWSAHCLHEKRPFTEGLINGQIPFEVSGIFIKKVFGENDCKVYVPAPATWYCDSKDKAEKSADFEGKKLCIAKEEPLLKECFAAASSAEEFVFAEPKEDAKPLAGTWISLDFIRNPKVQFGKNDVLPQREIYSLENRTGVGLTPDKRAVDGQLYTSSHLRFHDGVSIVVTFENEPEFNFTKLFLGGEKRVAQCRKCKDLELPPENGSGRWFSLVPVEATAENLASLVASSKIVTTAGWDMAKGFHKPSV
ncbi:hypothetical protein IKP13_09955, partial [bacterium]|nr:hypothetical protein [bacterium]